MVNTLPCPGCVQALHFRKEQIGKTLRCPLCATSFRLTPRPHRGKPTEQPPRAGTNPRARARRTASTRPAARARSLLPLALVLTLIPLVGGVLVGNLLLHFSRPGPSQKKAALPRYNYGYNYPLGPDGQVQFKDDVRSQAGPAELDMVLVDSQGKQVDLKRYHGKKNVVLVVLRGFDGNVCLACRAQTSRLISQHAALARRDAEVLLVYPGERRHLDDFLQKAQLDAANTRPPFPVVLDEDLRLVDHLDIRDNLAKPATYILDKQGRVRFAYVGTDRADRPSMKAILAQLDALAAP
jgi:peroxiredoxin